METLTTAGRATRIAVTLVVLGLLVGTSLRGADDHFPFAPFRMFAGDNPPNAPAPDTRVEGIDRTGTLLDLGESVTGIRRAEIEGQQSRYEAEPELLRRVAEAYSERHPDAPELVEIRVVVRWHGIQAGRPTGRHTDETVARWQVR